MSQEIPAFLQRLLPAAQAVGQASIGGITGFPQPPHISIRGSRFHLVDGQGEEETLREVQIEVVVVDANPHVSRIYYGRDYDPSGNEAKPPQCFSDNGEAPSSMAMEPQHANCAGCPQAVWGSATSKLTGKGIPACSERKKLAVLYDGELFQLVIPPASLGNWKEYHALIARIPNVGITMVKTNISFDTKAVGILEFRASGFLDEATANQVFQITNDPALTIKLTNTDDKPHQARLSKPVEQQYRKEPAPVEDRIHTIMPGQNGPQVVPDSAVAGARQQLEASVKETEPPKRRKRNVMGNGPSSEQVAAANLDVAKTISEENAQQNKPAFGMTDATVAVNDDQLKALLAGAMDFAKKQ